MLAYDTLIYNTPVWQGNTVFYETVFPIGNKEDNLKYDLLFAPTEVLKVYDYSLKREYVYKKDYTVTEKGIEILSGGDIPVMDIAERYDYNRVWNGFKVYGKDYNYTGISAKKSARYLLCVTYSHSEKWQGPIINNESHKLKSFFKKLENGKSVNVLWYGDSHVVGGDASGLHAIEPFNPIFPKAVTDKIQSSYPNANVNYINTALGSRDSEWGLINLDERVIAKKPDLVVVKFATNESGIGKAAFYAKTAEMIERINNVLPDCGIVLASGFSPELNVQKYHGDVFFEYERALYELQERYNNVQIAVCPIFTLSRYIIDKKGGYTHLTANNLNHHNDFGVRICANALLATLGI